MRCETKEPNICIKKCETDWRLISININSFPTERNGIEKGKYDLLKQTIAESEADIVGISELGKNENNIPYYSRLSNVIKTWVEEAKNIHTRSQVHKEIFTRSRSNVVNRTWCPLGSASPRASVN